MSTLIILINLIYFYKNFIVIVSIISFMHQEKINDDLRSIAKGNVLSDEWSKKIYSVDASEFAILPSTIIQVKDKEDISNICEYAYSKNLTLTGRGAGTGLLGQSLTLRYFT